MALGLDLDAEWLEADGLGGFASGTVGGVRSRRYHALLLAATQPPAGRRVLVNGFDAFVETENGRFALSSQRYTPDVVDPDAARHLEAFTAEPWPHWSYRLADGTVVEQELFVPHGRPIVAVCWRLAGSPRPATLTVRPFLSGRDYHALQHENGDFRFDPDFDGDLVTFRPYDAIPPINALANGGYVHEPQWYRNFLYAEERSRGLDHVEDLASPGFFRFDMEGREAVLILSAGPLDAATTMGERLTAAGVLDGLRATEAARRGAFHSRLDRAADAYLVRRGSGYTLIAGYPWFLDWGRDTFIAMRGLCLATGRHAEAAAILFEWAHVVSEGMLPNRFADDGEAPEFNSVDASLWYVVAVHGYLEAVRLAGGAPAPCPTCGLGARCLERAVGEILTGYAGGTRHGIRMDADGLLAAGEAGVQLTWMDAKVGDWVVTPRVGKPVEVQALWLNALRIGGSLDPRWDEAFALGRRSFLSRFWNAERGYLHDVVDVDHRPGVNDETLRPNAIFAVGGLPFPIVDGEKAKAIVKLVLDQLWTPIGLHSLGPREPGYAARYEGGVLERDGAYHQGTVWPFLIGPFVEAWVRVHGDTAEARSEARRRFLDPFYRHLDEAGLGHISEIAEAEEPHTPRGCPFQAWSLGEFLRLDRIVLAAKVGGGGRARAARNRAGARASKPVTPERVTAGHADL